MDKKEYRTPLAIVPTILLIVYYIFNYAKIILEHGTFSNIPYIVIGMIIVLVGLIRKNNKLMCIGAGLVSIAFVYYFTKLLYTIMYLANIEEYYDLYIRFSIIFFSQFMYAILYMIISIRSYKSFGKDMKNIIFIIVLILSIIADIAWVYIMYTYFAESLHTYEIIKQCMVAFLYAWGIAGTYYWILNPYKRSYGYDKFDI